MTLQDAFLLYSRLGVDVVSLTRQEFSAAYIDLAKRYHPDISPNTSGLMANINAARVIILNNFRPKES